MIENEESNLTIQARAKPQNKCWRHFKALMKKNFLNYKRTPVGTSSELLIPVFLALIVTLFKVSVFPYEVKDTDIYQLKKPYYPTTLWDEKSGNWTMTNYDNTQLGLDLAPFMVHSDYISVLNKEADEGAIYNPFLDPLGPFYMFPTNCFGKELAAYSPIIAFVDNGSKIGEDIAFQLDILFQKQRELRNITNEIIDAVKNPREYRSVSSFTKLLEGGSTEEQLNMMERFGVSRQVVHTLQVLTLSENPQYQDTVLNNPKQIVQIIGYAEGIEGETSLQTLAKMNEQRAEYLLQNVDVNMTADFLGVEENQVRGALSEMYKRGFNETGAQSLGGRFNLSEEQSIQIYNALPSLIRNYDIEVADSIQVELLSELIDGNLTNYEFEQRSGSTVVETATKIGMVPAQVEALVYAIKAADQKMLMYGLEEARGDPMSTKMVVNRFGITPELAYLLQESFDVTGSLDQNDGEIVLLPSQITKIIELEPDFIKVLVVALMMPEKLNVQQIDFLIPEYQTRLDLDASQTSQLRLLFLDQLDGDNFDNFYRIIGMTQEEYGKYITTIPEKTQDKKIDDLLTLMQLNDSSKDEVFEVINVLAPTNQTLAENIGDYSEEKLNQVIAEFSSSEKQEQQIRQYFDILEKVEVYPSVPDMSIEADSYNASITKLFSKSAMEHFGKFEIRRFKTVEELYAYQKEEDYGRNPFSPSVCYGFQVKEEAENDIEVELLFNMYYPDQTRGIPNQNSLAFDPLVKYPSLGNYQLYTQNGYVQLQNLISNTILRRKTGKMDARITAMIVPTKVGQILIDSGLWMISAMLNFVIIAMWLPLVYRTTYRIVQEKQSQAKETMRIMGMSIFPYWCSWFCTYTFFCTLSLYLFTTTLNLAVISTESSPTFFLLNWINAELLFAKILICSSLFQSPRSASIICSLFYIFANVFYVAMQNTNSFEVKKTFCMWDPFLSNGQAIRTLMEMERVGVKAVYENWDLQFQGFSIRHGLQLVFVGGSIQMLLGVYLECLSLGQNGKKRHPLFFLGCPWSCRRKGQTFMIEERVCTQESNEANDDFEMKYLKPECYEAPDPTLNQNSSFANQVRIQDLKKEYENGFKAVRGLNIKMFCDQIFVLLGHNGAGKSTTIGMLTGLVQPTDGDANVFGLDLYRQQNEVRKLMGVCPQYDVLFELLTCREHLDFFYELKGADPNPQKKRAEINQLMIDLGVWDKRDALSFQLSGGNKRKLSVALALCGHSKFVLLDEPTSGMDLQSRRQMWDVLKQYKKDRVIVLTTHYMDEADILGDRIGIMAKGKMTCLGSSIFLKSKFGTGYNLQIVKDSCESNPQLFAFIQEKLGPNVCLTSEIQQEMTVRIPFAYCDRFQHFFNELENNIDELQVQSYGVSISTLEEVFLKVGHLEDPTIALNQVEVQKTIKIADDCVEGQPDFNLKDNQNELDKRFIYQVSAVIQRRVQAYRRSKLSLFLSFLSPLIIFYGTVYQKPFLEDHALTAVQDVSRLPKPLPQKLIVSSVTSKEQSNCMTFGQNLPEADSVFDIKWSQESNFHEFGDEVFELGNTISKFPYLYGSYQVYEWDVMNHIYSTVSFVNTTSQDATQLFPAFMYESILKSAMDDPSFSLKFRSTPFPKNFNYRLQNSQFQQFYFVIWIGTALGVFFASIISQVITERLSGIKHLQEISGLSRKAYWVGTFIVDATKYAIILACMCYSLRVLDDGYFKDSIWIFIVSPVSFLPFIYVTSFLYNSDSGAQTGTIFLQIFTMGILGGAISFLRINPGTEDTGDFMIQLMKVMPTFLVASTMQCDTSCKIISLEREGSHLSQGKPLIGDKWHFSNLPLDLLLNFVHAALWISILVLIENDFFARFKKEVDIQVQTEQLDDDVQKEKDRIRDKLQDKDDEFDAIEVNDFRKVYKLNQRKICRKEYLAAVQNLSFSVKQGECFALLGVNGAGKSTTFKSLTREVVPTSGQIKISGYDINTDFNAARKLIGYCPQPNNVFTHLTVEEHIQYYAKIKGLPQNRRTQLVNQAISWLGLEEQRKKLVGTLSGGNQRKVCVADALVGNPPIILLDEPSAGMDPEARRFMWTVVARIAHNKSSAVVLTTHSMEEAEALSTKMGIMVKGGVFKCIGSAQHIKNKFGKDFIVQIKIKERKESELWPLVSKFFSLDKQGELLFKENTQFSDGLIAKIKSKLKNQSHTDLYRTIYTQEKLYQSVMELCEEFGEIEVLEQFGSYMSLRFSRDLKSIGQIFGVVETLKVKCDVEGYSVSQTSLEQIFQSFADLNFSEKVTKFYVKKGNPQDMEMQGKNLLMVAE